MKYKDMVPMERRSRCICGKVTFDKRSAQGKRNQLLKMGKERYLRIYKCEQSNYWHLTKQDRPQRYGK